MELQTEPERAVRPCLPVMAYSPDHRFEIPSKRLTSPADMAFFGASQAFEDINTFLLQLNVAMFPRRHASPDGTSPTVVDWPVGSSRIEMTEPVKAVQRLLATFDQLVDETEPQSGPRRFGNVAFRTWYGRAFEQGPALVRQVVEAGGDGRQQEGATTATSWLRNTGRGPTGARAELGLIAARKVDTDDAGVVVEELFHYLMSSFGSPERLDYGTGHELNFVAFLACLWKLGVFGSPATMVDNADPAEPDVAVDDSDGQNTERAIVTGLVVPYLGLVRKLIVRYTLEPAGSHGSWGLDDHAFVPYIFGSAQLSNPIAVASDITTRGSLDTAPESGAITQPQAVADWRDQNLYFAAIGFISDVKRGNFWEHSPLLFDVSRLPGGWARTNNGMIAMFSDHVLAKFPVVQHFPFGSILAWKRSDRRPRRPLARVVRDLAESNAAMSRPPSGTSRPPAFGSSSSQTQRPVMFPSTHSTPAPSRLPTLPPRPNCQLPLARPRQPDPPARQ